MKWIIALLTFSWFAAFTSQSLIDLSDILITLSALYFAYKNQELKKLFTQFKPAILWPIWLTIVITGIVINFSITNFVVWNESLEFRWMLSFLAIVYINTKVANAEASIKIISWILLILNLISFVLFYNDINWRAGGVLNQIMAFSHNIAPVFCLFLVFLLAQWKFMDRNLKILVGAVAITSGLLTLLTFTRGVWVGSFIGILIAIFIWNKKVFLSTLISAFILAGTLVTFHEGIRNRVFSQTSNETDSNNQRLALWRGNWRIIQDHPWFGVGFGQNKYHLRKYYDEMGYPPGQRESHAHNQYLQMWAGTGTFGLICFLFFFYLILQKTLIGYSHLKGFDKNLQLGLFAALMCYMIGAATESNFNIAKNRFFFLVLAGWAIANFLKSKKDDIKQ